jgi:hypothetical protein
MQSINGRKRSTELTAILTLFEGISLLGLGYCLLMLAGVQNITAILPWRLVLYASWFAISAVGVYAMLHWKRWGAYMLAIATLAITFVDISQGYATWGGASMGLVIAVLLVIYLYPHWMHFD